MSKKKVLGHLNIFIICKRKNSTFCKCICCHILESTDKDSAKHTGHEIQNHVITGCSLYDFMLSQIHNSIAL